MKTGKEYRESLQVLSPIIYCNGERIYDVVAHPMTIPHVNSAAMTYQLAHQEEYFDLMTAESNLIHKRINRFTHFFENPEDLVKKVKMLRMVAQHTGTCFQRCVGLDAMNATYIVTHNIDKKHGTDYHRRFLEWSKYVQENDLMIAGSMTDPKGDRSLSPAQQNDKDLYTRVVKKTKEGVIIRGAKAHQTGIVNSHEMLIMPTVNLTKGNEDYAIACAIPIDAEGVIHIFGRQTNDQRRLQGKIDTGNSNYAVVGGEALTIFEDVFVPWDRVFMCGEIEFVQDYVIRFAAYHRQNYGGCKVGTSDVLIGATALLADMNGTAKASHIKSKLVEMVHNAETMYCCSLACSYECHKTDAGLYDVDTLLANETKLNCTKNIYEITRIAHDIAGGIIATLPYEADLKCEKVGALIEKYFAANKKYDAIDRIKIARLVENMSGGTALVESMHGAGSPQALVTMISRECNMEKKIEWAQKLAGISTEKYK